MEICVCGKSFKNKHALVAHHQHCILYRKTRGLGDPPQPFIRKDGSDPRGWIKGLTKQTCSSIVKGIETKRLNREKNGIKRKGRKEVVILGEYKEVFLPDHPFSRKDGYVYEHTLVAERKIGRYISKGEVVHHVDGNKQNNVPDNLWVFKTTNDHTRYHSMLFNGKQPRVEQVEPGVYICVNDNIRLCAVCGVNLIGRNNKTGLCRECFLKSGKTLTKKNIPNYVELNIMLENGESCLTLAEKYGTSYQTIRSRIRKRI